MSGHEDGKESDTDRIKSGKSVPDDAGTATPGWNKIRGWVMSTTHAAKETASGIASNEHVTAVRRKSVEALTTVREKSTGAVHTMSAKVGEINQGENVQAIKKSSAQAWEKTVAVTTTTATTISESTSKFYTDEIVPASHRVSKTTAKIYKEDIVPATQKVAAAASAGASAAAGVASTTVEKIKKDMSSK